MKIAIAHDKDKNIVPLQEAESIAIYNDEDGSIKEYDNDGFGSKEATMGSILRLEPDAVAVKEGILCPGSYMMSQGMIKYLVVEGNTVDNVIAEKKAGSELAVWLDESMYAE